MTENRIECESRITRVVVYARGAMITRRVELPVSVPSEAVSLAVTGVSPLAEPGSLRTVVEGERKVTGLRTRLVFPTGPGPAKYDDDRIAELSAELERVQKQIERVENLHTVLEEMELEPRLLVKKKEGGALNIRDRVGAALRVSGLVDTRVRRLETELRELRTSYEDLHRRLQEAHRDGKPTPRVNGRVSREIVVGLAEGPDHLRALEVCYSVRAARWWPAYSARLSDGGRRAEFSLEAFVAQNSLEDWSEAELSLCTADMIRDVRLPVLDSLRFGRRQPPKASGYREPPGGRDGLFQGYDAAFTELDSTLRNELAATEVEKDKKQGAVYRSEPKSLDEPAMPEEDLYDDEADEDVVLASMVAPGSGAVSAEAPPSPSPARTKPAGRKKKRPHSNRGARRRQKLEETTKTDGVPNGADRILESGAGGGPAAPDWDDDDDFEETIGTSDEWLDFDALEMGHAMDYSRRGRLAASGATRIYDQTSNMISSIEAMSAPGGASDPLHVRGLFDHRFDADGAVDIPANGRAHRIHLLTRKATSAMHFRCVPREDERVFREVSLENPLNAPLLPGPVDVFLDGALTMTSNIDAVDRGGAIRFGLGEEERLRVARNVRVHEESKGLLGGTTEIDHTVTIEAASSLGVEVQIEVIGGIPVSDDEKIEVELNRSTPEAKRYDQVDRGQLVKGGLRWLLTVPAGGKAKIEYEYSIRLPADYELEGGNRRD